MIKKLTDQKIIDELFNMKSIEFTKTYIMNLFGDFGDGPRCNPTDILIVPKGKYMDNKNEFRTTVGIFIFNKRTIVGNGLFPILGYINKTLTSKLINDEINKKLSYALCEDKITTKQFNRYLDDIYLYMRFVSVLSPNHTMKLLSVPDHIRSLKNKLIAKHKEELAKGNVVVANEIEKELLKSAKEYLKDDPSLDIYESGSRASFDNTFKNMYVMKGGIMKPDGSGFDVVSSNFMDGISNDEYHIFANSLVAGIYDKAINTAVSGYITKLFIYLCQNITIAEKGSDCGTKNYIEVVLTNDNVDQYMYNYMIEGSKLIRLDSSNYNSYLNKKCKFRFSSLCEYEKDGKLCNKCIGDLYYMLGIDKVGLLTPIIPNTLVTKSMKKFHDSTIKINEIDVSKAFGFSK